MTAKQLLNLFSNAGFQVSQCVGSADVVVSLKNRIVSLLEIQEVLGTRRNKFVKSGRDVLVIPITYKVR